MKHSKKVLPITLLVVLGGGIAATSVYAQDASKFLKTFFTSVEVTHKAETESTFHLFEKMADKKTSEATTANLTKDEVIQKLKDNTTRMTINIPQEIQDKVVLLIMIKKNLLLLKKRFQQENMKFRMRYAYRYRIQD